MIFTPDYLQQVLEGSYVLVDKPYGWTSFDVVNKVRYIFTRLAGVKKIKVGHAGTLDPLATGLLVLCTGKFTKRIDEIQALPKTYTGTFTLGATTPSFDLETEINATYAVDHITPEKLEGARQSFLGEISQVAPAHSAKFVNGVRAYELARQGKEVNLAPNQVHIYKFELTDIQLPQVSFEVQCSKGTYIRSLANDFGKALQSGAYLSSLRRTAIGDFLAEDALSIELFKLPSAE